MTMKRLIPTLLVLALLAASLVVPACAQKGEKVVRVGWYESPFNMTDRFGRRSGYAYEYQRKITAYTGWRYEYVEGSWSELMGMLKNGEIDLMSDVSYMEERTQSMLYASLPMGTESYYVYIAPDNAEISSADYTTLSGKKVAVTKDSIQKDLFLDWATLHGVRAEIVEVTDPEDESIRKLLDGEYDAFLTMDIYGDPDIVAPVCKIGSSDFYFAVNKNRPDLLIELDAAMNRIQDENKYYNLQLHEKYLSSTATNQYLSEIEKKWVLDHGVIRVGYQDNYLAFCASDEATGALTGALKDFLDFASTCLVNAHLEFEAVSFPTAAAAMEALAKGEIDCMFPANLTDYDGENRGVVMSPVLMRTEMDAVVRAADQKEFVRNEHVKVAVNEGNTNYEMFLVDHYPGWEIVYYPDTPTGLEGVAAGEADCVIISNYRFNNISKQCEKLHLTTVYTGVNMDYCLAVREGDTELYSILARVIDAVPDAVVHTALTYYSTEDVKITFGDLIRDNLFIVMAVIAAVLLVILALLLRSIHAEKKAREEEHLVKDLNKRVYVDALTSVRNKGAFNDYMRQLQDRVDKEELVEFAIGIFDCDNLKQINDHHGHDKGDIYIKTACQLICRTFDHSPVFRIGGDEFAVVLQNGDYDNRKALIHRFNVTQRETCEAAEHHWEEPHIAMGVAEYDPQMDGSVDDTLRRADKIMYENKRVGKKKR